MSIDITHLTNASLNDRDLRAVDGTAKASLGAPPAVAVDGTTVPGPALSAEALEQLTADIVAALKTVYGSCPRAWCRRAGHGPSLGARA